MSQMNEVEQMIAECLKLYEGDDTFALTAFPKKSIIALSDYYVSVPPTFLASCKNDKGDYPV